MRGNLPLREYQRTAIDKIRDAWDTGVQRPAVVLPTGAGKTVIFSHLAREILKDRKGGNVLILVHREELATQTVAKLHAIAPHLSVGVVKAERDEVDADVIVGSVQTLRKSARLERLPKITAVIVDECHHATADSYVKILRYVGCMDVESGTPAVGFTATMGRDDAKTAKVGLGDIWQKIIFSMDILDMIPDGYLVDPRGIMVTIDGMSLAEAKIVKGDFSESSLSDLLLDADAQHTVAQAYAEHAKDRKGLLFAPTVKAAHAFADAFNAAGITTEVVHGSMSADDRRFVLKRFASGETQVLSNCMVLTEGFDQPDASAVVIARPTRSASLYVQMVGRVLRPFPGKADALVLDVVGATEDHTLATLADLSTGRVDTVEPGESLMGAAKRIAKRGVLGLARYAVGVKAVSLFERSKSVWAQTDAGLWFVSTGCGDPESCDLATDGTCRGHLVFLWPGSEPGTYRVGICPTYARGGRWVTDEDVDLSTAMAVGEQTVEATDSGFLTSKRAAWRRRNEPPSPAQVGYARRLGIEISDGITKSGLSDLINKVVASRRLDGRFRK